MEASWPFPSPSFFSILYPKAAHPPGKKKHTKKPKTNQVSADSLKGETRNSHLLINLSFLMASSYLKKKCYFIASPFSLFSVPSSPFSLPARNCGGDSTVKWTKQLSVPQLCPSVIDILQVQARMAEGPSDLYVHIPILPKSVWLMCRLHYNEHVLPAFFFPQGKHCAWAHFSYWTHWTWHCQRPA